MGPGTIASVLDHLSIQCADVPRSARFYDAVLAALAGARVMDFGTVIGNGVGGRPTFWVGPLNEGGDNRPVHVAFVMTDGLSARAVERHALPLLAALLPPLRAAGWRIAPLTIVRQGRVAIGDAVAQQLSARMVAILIGERKRLAQLSDQCARFPVGSSKTQQALQVIDTTTGILTGIRDRL